MDTVPLLFESMCVNQHACKKKKKEEGSLSLVTF